MRYRKIGSILTATLLLIQSSTPLLTYADDFVPNVAHKTTHQNKPQCNIPGNSNSDDIDDTTTTGSGLDDPVVRKRAEELAKILNEDYGLSGETIAGILGSPLNHENQTLDPMLIEGGTHFATPLSTTGEGTPVGPGYTVPGSSIFQFTPYTKYTTWKDFKKYGGHTVEGNTRYMIEVGLKDIGTYISIANWTKYGVSNSQIAGITSPEDFYETKDIKAASIIFMTCYERGSYSLGQSYFDATAQDSVLAYKKLGLSKYKADPQKIKDKVLNGGGSSDNKDDSDKDDNSDKADNLDPCQENDDSKPSGELSVKEIKEAVGKVVGSGQCYALSSFYVHTLTNGKYSLGAGITGGTQITGPNTSAAAAIGDLNWSGTLPKWKVIKNPKYSDLRPGDIVNWKAGSQLTKGSTYTVDPTYGHTAIISSVDGDNKYTAYSQNPTPVTIVHWEYVGSFASLVRPVM